MLKLTWTVPCSSFSHPSRNLRGVSASKLTTISQKGPSTANQLGLLLFLRNRSNSKMGKFVCNSVQPGAPGGGPWNSWQAWIFGVVVTLILPFCRSKWGPFLTIKNQVDKVANTVEAVAEVIEQVAEKVEEIADEIGDTLPENGKLKGAFDLVEKIAKETAKDAHIVDEFIEKVEEVEDKVESLLEPISEDETAREGTKKDDQTKETTTT